MARKSLCLLFCALTLIYHSNLRPIAASDSMGIALVPLALVMDGTPRLDRFGPWLEQNVWYAPAVLVKRDGHYLTSYPVGQGALIAPLYAVPIVALRLWQWDTADQVAFARICEKFVAAFLTALGAVLMLLLLERIASPPWPWILTLVFALGTNTWATSSQALWQHSGGELLIVAASYCLVRWREDSPGRRWLLLAGSAAGLAMAVRPTNVLAAAAVCFGLLVCFRSFRILAAFAAPGLVCGLLLMAYNLAAYGSLRGGYGILFLTDDVPRAMAGLLISPARGLLIYSPVLIFAAAAWWCSPRRKERSLPPPWKRRLPISNHGWKSWGP